MKVIDINELWHYDIAVSGISVIKQTPTWNNINCASRQMNGFLLMTEGALHYYWNDSSEIIKHGDLIYLPLGSIHKCDIYEKGVSYYRINFTLTDMSDGENVIFSDCPIVFNESLGEQMFELCIEMCRSCLTSRNFLTVSLFGEFMNSLTKLLNKNPENRIERAVNHISAHYTEETDMDKLTDLCHLSKPHLFRLFKAQTGCSPIEYRNKLRIDKAKKLIAEGDLNMSEIASIVGFTSLYYFSRCFKKETGISPLMFSKTDNN